MFWQLFMNVASSGSGTVVDFSNIGVTSPATSGTNTDQTLTFAGGGTHSLYITYYMVGAIYYRINSGTWINVASGYAFNVTSDQTLGFKYENINKINESRNVYLIDATDSILLDSFEVVYAGGGGGGIGGGGGGGGYDPGPPPWKVAL